MDSVRVDPRSSRPLAAQIANSIRDIILAEGIRAGARLPATRTLADELGVSRTTMVEVFERLIAEGLVESRVGAGTFVRRLPGDINTAKTGGSAVASHRGELQRGPGSAPRETHGAPQPVAPSGPPRPSLPSFVRRISHDNVAFAPSLPALDLFPVARWSRLLAKHLREPRDISLGYGDNSGFLPLRRMIASHLRAARGIICDERQVFIVNGSQQAFHVIASTLLEAGDKAWIENPGTSGACNALLAAKAQVVAVPVDQEGISVSQGHKIAPDFRLAFVTPSHQRPLSVVMSLARRFQLLAAAEAADAWIVEYDCDGDFHYADQPLPAIISADRAERVLYVGSFSKTLFPSLRLGYMVVPRSLVDFFNDVFNAYLPGVPLSTQSTLASFMEEGYFAMHVRRMRRIYEQRQSVLIEASQHYFGELLTIQEVESGLDTVGYLPPGLDENLVAQRAKDQGITVEPFSKYCIEAVPLNGLVFGFSSFKPEQIQAGTRVLGRLLEAMASDARARPLEAAQ